MWLKKISSAECQGMVLTNSMADSMLISALNPCLTLSLIPSLALALYLNAMCR